MKIITSETYIFQTVECNTAQDATAALTRYIGDGWIMNDSGEYHDEKWYYTFKKEMKEDTK